MIIQPIFPPSFASLIKTIVSKQLSVYRTKQKIHHRDARTLFDTIDYLKTGQIYLEDLYAYLKTKGLAVSKRELKFLNRYFGFSSHQKLNFLLFKQNFLFSQEKDNQNDQERQECQDLFINLVKLAVESYNEIEKLRSMVSLNISQLEDCFQLYYPESSKAITKPILQELLAIFGLYSRLNLYLLTKYMIGDEATQVNIRQLFWNSNANQQSSLNMEESKSKYKKQSSAEDTQELFTSFNETKNLKSLDILAQIENIQASIRSKHNRNSYKKDSQEILLKKRDSQEKLFENPSHRASENNLSSYFAKQSMRNSRSSKFKKSEVSQFTSIQKQKDDLEEILKRSLGSFEEKDPIEQREAQIQELLKNRTKSKTREEVLSRASSAAKLKIQEIQKRVFSKNKMFPSGIQHSALRTPSNLIINNEYRSKNTSLRKK